MDPPSKSRGTKRAGSNDKVSRRSFSHDEIEINEYYEFQENSRAHKKLRGSKKTSNKVQIEEDGLGIEVGY